MTAGKWRSLTVGERRVLEENGNSSSDWDGFLVTDGFEPSLVSGSRFSGICRIALTKAGDAGNGELRLPVGISNSRICSCTVGDGSAIHDVGLLSGYEIGQGCLLFDIGRMTGDEEFVCPEIEIMNETGTRRVAAFPGMTTSDAWLMAKYPDDDALQRCLNGFSGKIRLRPAVGADSRISNVQLIHNLSCGPYTEIGCAVQISSVYIGSTVEEPVSISGNAVLSNGVIGAGSRVTGGCIADRFSVGVNCTLSGGVRFFNSVLGDNSTVSCCEIVGSLIFPAHEQHHNNSFLIAACIGGQSNVAAGATIGSNHNGRTADGELSAGRGFWPGLCVSLKHSSSFACYTMIAKGAYPAELDIRLPFSLVSDNECEGRLEIIPAFAWLYNMYALVRTGLKYSARDCRKDRRQHIEFDVFAPDSMQEVAAARLILETWAEKYCGWKRGEKFPSEIVLSGEGVEKSRRPVAVLKADRARDAYGEMLVHYAAKCMAGVRDSAVCTGDELPDVPDGSGNWLNFGGQPVREEDADRLRSDICSGRLASWEDVQRRLDEIWEEYPVRKYGHALHLLTMSGVLENPSTGALFGEEERILGVILERAEESRAKDFDNPFRAATYRNAGEMRAVVGDICDDVVLKRLRERTEECLRKVAEMGGSGH